MLSEIDFTKFTRTKIFVQCKVAESTFELLLFYVRIQGNYRYNIGLWSSVRQYQWENIVIGLLINLNIDFTSFLIRLGVIYFFPLPSFWVSRQRWLDLLIWKRNDWLCWWTVWVRDRIFKCWPSFFWC